MLKSYYEILNIKEDATKDEIKLQFKKLAKMYHPDVNTSLEAENIFKEIKSSRYCASSYFRCCIL